MEILVCIFELCELSSIKRACINVPISQRSSLQKSETTAICLEFPNKFYGILSFVVVVVVVGRLKYACSLNREEFQEDFREFV